jgi:hypothetical protein
MLCGWNGKQVTTTRYILYVLHGWQPSSPQALKPASLEPGLLAFAMLANS